MFLEKSSLILSIIRRVEVDRRARGSLPSTDGKYFVVNILFFVILINFIILIFQAT